MLSEAKTQIMYNVSLSYDLMLPVPPIVFLNKIEHDDAELIKTADTHRIFKNMAIEKMEGLDVGQLAYYDNGFYLKTVVISSDNLMAGGIGPKLPANCTTVFPGVIKHLENPMKLLGKKIKEEDPNYKGLVCIEATLTPRRPYWRLIDFNVPKDYLYAMEILAGDQLSNLVEQSKHEGKERPKGYGVTTRVYAYPYDKEENLAMEERNCLDQIAIQNDDCSNFVAWGATVKGAWSQVYAQIPKKTDICFRNDGDQKARYVVNELKRCQYLI